MRFIASADWQIGMTASYLSEDARPRFRQARLEAIRRLGRLARERDAAFVLVCGDVFESNQLDRQVVARAFEALKDVPVPVYLLPGNHDPLDASSIYRSAAFVDGCPEHVHVLAEPGATPAVAGVEIVAAPWFSKRPLADLVAQACADLAPGDG
ncbi:MAG: metallophosphoesterase family protein, partial [Nocardioidaceae bacterium]